MIKPAHKKKGGGGGGPRERDEARGWSLPCGFFVQSGTGAVRCGLKTIRTYFHKISHG